MIVEISNLMKMLSDRTRLRIINVLSQKHRCVCELVRILNLPQPSISRHLAKMRLAGLLRTSRKDAFVIYSINSSIMKKYPFLQSLIFETLHREFPDDMERAQKINVLNKRCVVSA